MPPIDRLSGTTMGARSRMSSTTGTLTKNTQCQLMKLDSTPPSTNPKVKPAPPVALKTPNALLRSGPSAKVVARIETAEGAVNAAPITSTPRHTLKSHTLVASPPETEPRPQSVDPSG